MTTEDRTNHLPTETVILNSAEQLSFLRMIEGGLPEGIRAYIVSIESDGRRSIAPVRSGCDIVSMNDATDLIAHLNNNPFLSAEVVAALRDFVDARLDRAPVSKHSVRAVMQLIREDREQLEALAAALESSLGNICDDEEQLAEAPMREWRLAQVMKRVLEEDSFEKLVAVHLDAEACNG
jgi:hypothetical protein